MVTKPVTAAGGVVHKREKNSLFVLLIFRRDVWDLPKGKVEEGESVRECAVREVAEEVGLSALPVITKQLVQTYHEYEQGSIRFGKTTHWFAMELNANSKERFKPQTEEDIEEVQWVPLSEAKSLVGYDNLIEVLQAFEEQSVGEQH